MGRNSGQKKNLLPDNSEGIKYYKQKCEEWELTKKVINKFVKELESNGDN